MDSILQTKIIPAKLVVVLCLIVLLAPSVLHSGEIHDEVMACDLNKVRALIETNPGLLKTKDDRGLPPLHIAFEYGKVEIANFLIDKGTEVNAMDNDNYTQLIRACLFRNHIDFLRACGPIDIAIKKWNGVKNEKDTVYFSVRN